MAEKKQKQIGEVSNYFAQVKAAAIKLTAPLKVGDKIALRGGEKDVEMEVKSMQIDRKPVDSAKKGEEIGILVPEDVHKGYRVFKL
jgi:ribosomal 50S subunit-recycling heat shock protein